MYCAPLIMIWTMFRCWNINLVYWFPNCVLRKTSNSIGKFKLNAKLANTSDLKLYIPKCNSYIVILFSLEEKSCSALWVWGYVAFRSVLDMYRIIPDTSVIDWTTVIQSKGEKQMLCLWQQSYFNHYQQNIHLPRRKLYARVLVHTHTQVYMYIISPCT